MSKSIKNILILAGLVVIGGGLITFKIIRDNNSQGKKEILFKAIYDPFIDWPDQFCPETIYQGGPYKKYNINGCIYREYGQFEEIGKGLEKRDCSLKMDRELKKNEYNVVNGCLYKNSEKVFDKNLYSLIKAGEFGERFISNKLGKGIGENANEWFRFEDNGKLYIFIYGTAGCGGCFFSGPYLEIDLASGLIEKASTTAIPVKYNMVISPNKKKAVEVSFVTDYDKEKGEIIKDTTFYIFDFLTFKRTNFIYKLSADKSIIECGDGCRVAPNSIEWVTNDMIKVQPFKHDNWGNVFIPIEDGEQIWDSYMPDGEPIIINIY